MGFLSTRGDKHGERQSKGTVEELRMMRLEHRSELSREQVLQQLKHNFGEGGLGLELKEQTATCVTFEGGGGYITASVCEDKGGTRVDIVSQEWDYHVKNFISNLR